MRAGRKAAATRAERQYSAEQNIPADLVPIWDAVKWSLPYMGRPRSEVFLEWAERHPTEIRAMRSRNEKRRAKAFERLQSHCAKLARRAEKELNAKKWKAGLAAETAERLEACAESTGDESYQPDRLEALLRLENTGAPF